MIRTSVSSPSTVFDITYDRNLNLILIRNAYFLIALTDSLAGSLTDSLNHSLNLFLFTMTGISKSFYMCGAVDLVVLSLFAMYQLRLSFIASKIKKESLVVKKKRRMGFFGIKDVNAESVNIVLKKEKAMKIAKEKDIEREKEKEKEKVKAKAQKALLEANNFKDKQKKEADSAAAAVAAAMKAKSAALRKATSVKK